MGWCPRRLCIRSRFMFQITFHASCMAQIHDRTRPPCWCTRSCAPVQDPLLDLLPGGRLPTAVSIPRPAGSQAPKAKAEQAAPPRVDEMRTRSNGACVDKVGASLIHPRDLTPHSLALFLNSCLPAVGHRATSELDARRRPRLLSLHPIIHRRLL